ncbi:hypothetical protein BVI434_100016 [Burkholderia vietnamiensis]|nr:hypothetical protein BVI434_100016 [Burkholderia vietnamiensis]
MGAVVGWTKIAGRAGVASFARRYFIEARDPSVLASHWYEHAGLAASAVSLRTARQ